MGIHIYKMPLTDSGVEFTLGINEEGDYIDNPNYVSAYYKTLQETNFSLFEKIKNLFEYLTYF